jgi:sulfide:quinone oxidoreductase
MVTRVVVLGAGFGGLELSARVAQGCGNDAEVLLIDRSDGFVFGFSKLDVMFGRAQTDHVTHRYADLATAGVRFLQAEILALDPDARRIETDAGTFDADILVVALGADLHPESTPGLLEAGHEFYTVAGAFALRDVLAEFAGGRVVVGVTGTPFKCPPAPSECALLVHELLSNRGIRDSSQVTLVMPFGVPIPPSPQASQAVLAAFTDRDITWRPNHVVTALDGAAGAAGAAVLEDGSTIPYDLFLGVPQHRVPQVVLDSGMCVDGWVPVDPLTLQTPYPGVYAVGDVASVGTPKAGVFAEGQAVVAADRIIASILGDETSSEYDGHGICYLEFGQGSVAKVDVVFRPGERPVGDLQGPSSDLHSDKVEFGSSRINRWFGRPWHPLG